MNNLLYIVAVVFIVLWAVGYFGYNAGAIIHVLIIAAIIALLFRIVQGGRYKR